MVSKAVYDADKSGRTAAVHSCSPSPPLAAILESSRKKIYPPKEDTVKVNQGGAHNKTRIILFPLLTNVSLTPPTLTILTQHMHLQLQVDTATQSFIEVTIDKLYFFNG